jgi:arsenite methyltransferase
MHHSLKRGFVFLLSVAALLLCILISCTNHQAHQTSVQHELATQQRFTDIEHWIKMFEDPERDKWQKPAEVTEAMNLSPGDVVADIGAGTGYFTRHFAVAVAPGGKALGLDIEPSMIKYMNEDARKLNLASYEARVVKTDDPELAPGSVDVVFLCDTYHHIENRVEYFRNVAKSLRPNGRVIIVDFHKDMDFGPPREHKLAEEIVLKEMKEAGYKLIKSHDILQDQYFI